VEAGVALVDADAFRDDEPAQAQDGGDQSLLRRLLRTTKLIAEETPPEPVAHGGTHRRSDLVFRLESRAGISAGENVQLSIDTDRILLFAEDGRRVDKVER
jgi:multiple sugar transport system ATP-binding protein